MHVLLCGEPPFFSDKFKLLVSYIQHSPVTFREYEWDNVSQEAKDLILKLLEKDPSKRLTCDEALESKWFQKF
jgi:serine/threonine protein kinase